MAVDALESLAQQLARLAVDLADRAVERVHRLFEVGGLRVEVALALLARAELLERRQVDRPELADRLREARDLALQGGRARGLLRCARESGFVRARLAQLRGELLRIELRGLLLEAQFTEALAQRRDPRVHLQASLFPLV